MACSALRDLILLVIGTVIGSGMFLVAGSVWRQTGGQALGLPAHFVWRGKSEV